MSISHLFLCSFSSDCNSSNIHHFMLKISSFQILIFIIEFTSFSLSLRTKILLTSKETCATMKFNALATIDFNDIHQNARTMQSRMILSNIISMTVTLQDWTAHKNCWLIIAILWTVLFLIWLFQEHNWLIVWTLKMMYVFLIAFYRCSDSNNHSSKKVLLAWYCSWVVVKSSKNSVISLSVSIELSVLSI